MDSTPAPTSPARSPGLACSIAVTALIAGTLDYSAAIANFLLNGGKDPTRIAWYIASSLLGHDTAYAGGWLTASFGILLHYAIATTWTIVFFLAYPRVAALGRHPVLSGAGYGLLVWTMMNLVFVPLTRIPRSPFNPTNAAIQASILVVCIGLPISLLARRHYAKT